MTYLAVLAMTLMIFTFFSGMNDWTFGLWMFVCCKLQIALCLSFDHLDKWSKRTESGSG